MVDQFSLLGKKILITGASSGIGQAIAISCSKRGANINLTARNEERLKETLDLLNEKDHLIIVADLNNEDDLSNLVQKLPKLDGVVLNAGINKKIPVKFIKKESLENIFNINVFSSFLIVKYLLKHKKLKDNSSIAIVSSVAYRKVAFANAIYGASKGAINSFTLNLALELAPRNIRVNAILPGMVKTNFIKTSAIPDESLMNHLKSYPLGRLGTPEDIANLAIYLLSDASSWMTGSLIKIDGGLTLT